MGNDIASKIAAGDESAFALFYQMEFDNIVYFVQQYLHDPTYAEDIAQESLISLWESRDIIDSEKNIRSYVFTIARNKTLNVLRSKRYRENRNAVEVDSEISALNNIFLSSRFDALNLEKLIDETYKRLPEKVRESFEFSRKYGLTNEQNARRQGVSVRTIEYHISIALSVFRKKLKDYMLFFIVCLPFLLYYM